MTVEKIKLGLLIIILILLTVLFNWRSGGEFGFDISQRFYVFVLFLLLFDIIYWENFLERIQKVKCYRLFYWWLFCLFAGALLATIFSVLPFESLFGTRFRHAGLIDFLFYFIFAAQIIITVKNVKDVECVIRWILIASFAVVGFGILEYFNLHYFYFKIFDKGIASVMGHPSFYGAYLAMMIPLTLGYLLYRNCKLGVPNLFWGNIFLFTLLFLQALGLIMTQTRAAWVAGIVSLAVFLLFYIFYIKNLKCNFRTCIILIAVITAIGFGLFKSDITSRYLRGIFDYHTGSGALRVIWWQNAIDAIEESPLLGYGPDTQKQVFFSHYNPAEIIYDPSGLKLNDRAHNEYLDLALMFGIPWLLIYLGFLFWLYIKGVRLVIRKREPEINTDAILVAALLTSLLAYMIQGFFSFSLPILYIYHFLSISLLVILLMKERGGHDSKNSDLDLGQRHIFRIVLTGFVLFLFIFTVIKPFFANYYLKGNFGNLTRDPFVPEDIGSLVLRYGQNTSGEIVFRLGLIEMYLNLYNQEKRPNVKRYLINRAKEQLTILQTKQPNDLSVLFYAGKIYFYEGSIDPTGFSKAQSVYTSLIEISPNFPWSYLYRSEVLVKASNYQGALSDLETILAIYPADTIESGTFVKNQLKRLRSNVYNRMGNIYIAMDRLNEAKEAYQKVVELTPLSEIGYQGLGVVYSLKKEWQKAWRVNLRAVIIHPSLSILKNQILYGINAGYVNESKIYARRAGWLSADDEELKALHEELDKAMIE